MTTSFKTQILAQDNKNTMKTEQLIINLQKANKTLLETVNSLSLKLHYAEMVLEDVRDEARGLPADIYQDTQTFLNSETVTPRAAFLIHPDGKKEFRAIIDEMADIQAAVGGYFELIEDGEDCWVYADEDGRDKALEDNFSATTLLSKETIRKKGFNLVAVDTWHYSMPRSLLLGPILFVFKNPKDLLDKKVV